MPAIATPEEIQQIVKGMSERMLTYLRFYAKNPQGSIARTNLGNGGGTHGALVRRGLAGQGADGRGYRGYFLAPLGWAVVEHLTGSHRPADTGRRALDEALNEAYGADLPADETPAEVDVRTLYAPRERVRVAPQSWDAFNKVYVPQPEYVGEIVHYTRNGQYRVRELHHDTTCDYDAKTELFKLPTIDDVVDAPHDFYDAGNRKHEGLPASHVRKVVSNLRFQKKPFRQDEHGAICVEDRRYVPQRPAEEAPFQPGDRIVCADGITRTFKAMAPHIPGEPARVIVEGGGAQWIAEDCRPARTPAAEGSLPEDATHPDVVAAREALAGLAVATMTDHHDVHEPEGDEQLVRGYLIEPRGHGRVAVYWLESGKTIRRDTFLHGAALDCLADRFQRRGWRVERMLRSSVCVFAHRPSADAEAPAELPAPQQPEEDGIAAGPHRIANTGENIDGPYSAYAFACSRCDKHATYSDFWNGRVRCTRSAEREWAQERAEGLLNDVTFKGASTFEINDGDRVEQRPRAGAVQYLTLLLLNGCAHSWYTAELRMSTKHDRHIASIKPVTVQEQHDRAEAERPAEADRIRTERAEEARAHIDKVEAQALATNQVIAERAAALLNEAGHTEHTEGHYGYRIRVNHLAVGLYAVDEEGQEYTGHTLDTFLDGYTATLEGAGWYVEYSKTGYHGSCLAILPNDVEEAVREGKSRREAAEQGGVSGPGESPANPLDTVDFGEPRCVHGFYERPEDRTNPVKACERKHPNQSAGVFSDEGCMDAFDCAVQASDEAHRLNKEEEHPADDPLYMWALICTEHEEQRADACEDCAEEPQDEEDEEEAE
ncbi:hypothetical protein [Streptomyces sp. TRM68367]|uniref:hypothetical protein n=1 Tax=Streptomyces sp. TRM68367 TaxID=2758415 RepID=UPI00165A6BD0|nr:hypothetical protein [Streptomyces sp. TRM68367]MBC9730692.1 hypothetical protein [Streptomyces sp. TRM68367]